MVSLNGRLDFVRTAPPVLPMLNGAAECFQRGDMVAAGTRLREALRRQLLAMVEWHGLEIKAKRPTPRDYIKALMKAGICDSGGAQWFREILDLGNAAAHCQRVNSIEVGGALSILHCVLLSDPCGEPAERYGVPVAHHPMFARHDDEWDDWDDGDGWKHGEGVST